MPKVGMKPIRQSQLIEATLTSVEMHGLQGTTISTISKIAGVSTGIINHYFGGKQGLLEATVRFLLQSLKDELMSELSQIDPSNAMARLEKIVAANFSQIQVSEKGAKTWLAFWSQAMHDPQLARLQRVNQHRLISNLKASFRQIIPAEHVEYAAQTTAALIDGFWLRGSMSDDPNWVDRSAKHCINHIQMVVKQFQQ
jgi:TetR/AcrR family transcriptional repressor of bet genes